MTTFDCQKITLRTFFCQSQGHIGYCFPGLARSNLAGEKNGSVYIQTVEAHGILIYFFINTWHKKIQLSTQIIKSFSFTHAVCTWCNDFVFLEFCANHFNGVDYIIPTIGIFSPICMSNLYFMATLFCFLHGHLIKMPNSIWCL